MEFLAVEYSTSAVYILDFLFISLLFFPLVFSLFFLKTSFLTKQTWHIVFNHSLLKWTMWVNVNLTLSLNPPEQSPIIEVKWNLCEHWQKTKSLKAHFLAFNLRGGQIGSLQFSYWPQQITDRACGESVTQQNQQETEPHRERWRYSFNSVGMTWYWSSSERKELSKLMWFS